MYGGIAEPFICVAVAPYGSAAVNQNQPVPKHLKQSSKDGRR